MYYSKLGNLERNMSSSAPASSGDASDSAALQAELERLRAENEALRSSQGSPASDSAPTTAVGHTQSATNLGASSGVDAGAVGPPVASPSEGYLSDSLTVAHESRVQAEAMANDHVSIFVIGASGDLARKKTFPSIFSLFGLGLLPPHTRIYGFARSPMAHQEFLDRCVSPHLSGEFGDAKRAAFMQLCEYHNGASYDNDEAWTALASTCAKREEKYKRGNRVFYLAIPPSVFAATMGIIKRRATATGDGWTRVVVEKPFGRDLASFQELEAQTPFPESVVYRIDHYLGKEMVQNLLVLRFANAILEPVWNRSHVEAVVITFKEPFGTEGRGGYFDQFGIIRDVMQNHLTQVLSLIAMEAPVSMEANDVRDEKVKVLRCVAPALIDHCVVGQYGRGDNNAPAFIDDKTVPAGSTTPTYAMVVLHVRNDRWRGVPFIIKCGKALNERKAEIRVHFRQVGNTYFRKTNVNELVIRVQPDEAVYLKMNAKAPGMGTSAAGGGSPADGVVQTDLDLTYKERFNERLPDAYERLIYDVLRGDHNLFVRNDELEAAWEIFTPLLQQLEGTAPGSKPVRPIIYPSGTRGPPEADELAAKFGVRRGRGRYTWKDKEPQTTDGQTLKENIRESPGLGPGPKL